MVSGYLRYPDIHASDIVFVADDDLWLTGRAGGVARRLTAARSPLRHPRFSPDGTMIAFTSTQDGPGDVYVLRRDSGEIIRITWWSHASTVTAGWAADGRVLVASAWNAHYQRLCRIHAVDLQGGFEVQPYGVAGAVALGPDGAVATQSPNNRDSAAWKRYRGGTAAKLWLDPHGDGAWTRVLPDTQAGMYSPAWVGDRLAFTSDLAGDVPELPQAQLYSVDRQGGDLRQHTDHTMEQGFVRDARSDGTSVVYHARGQLYVMDGLDATATPLEVELPVTPTPVIADAAGVGQLAPDHGGDCSVVEWRGAAFTLTHRAGPARALCDRAGVRTRLPVVLGETGSAAYVTDDEGEYGIEVAPLSGGAAQRFATGAIGYPLEMVANPAGTLVALATHDHRVLLVAVPGGAVTDVDRCDALHPSDLTWSPDGRYLAFRRPVGWEGATSRIAIYDTQTKQITDVTDGRFDDFSPTFTRDGKHLAFLSARSFDPVYSAHGFALSFGPSVKPYLVPLRADEPSPFGPSVDGWRISAVLAARATDAGEAAPGEPDRDAAADAAVHCVVDSDAIAARVIPFPVPVGSYSKLRSVKDGVVWLREPAQEGVLGHSRDGVEGEPPAPELERWSFEARRADVINPAVTDYEVSGDGQRIVVRNKTAIVVQPADRKVEDNDQNRVAVDTSRLRRSIDPRSEWLQMFNEQGRFMRDLFWRADMDGVDWDGVLATYRPIVDRLATHDDLCDLLWETVGELNTGHAYVTPKARPSRPTTAAHLGADLTRLADGTYRIDAVVATDTSNPHARSPLAGPGVAAKSGELIVAVDGHRLTDGWSLGEALQGSADKPVEVTLRAAGEGAAERCVAVVPLASEYLLRYEAWVASRAEYVREHGKGRIGYVHVPDMGPMGWAEFYRRLADAMECDAVICDVRFNMGGNTSTMIVERLSRSVLGWGVARHFGPGETYPLQARRGPILFVTNEFAGSDGDIVCANVQAQQMGTVLGERSWGGVIGIDGMYGLVDGTGVTQPRYAHWFEGYGWDVENHGIDPDIEVPLTPADWNDVATVDVQLDAAIAELERQLVNSPAFKPVPLPRPRVGVARDGEEKQ